MHRDPKTIHDGIQSGDLDRLSRMLKPVTTAEIAELMLRGTEAEANSPAPPDPEDQCIGPAYPKHIRKLMRAYGHLSACPLDDHMTLARKCEELMEAAMEAADAEWRELEGGE